MISINVEESEIKLQYLFFKQSTTTELSMDISPR